MAGTTFSSRYAARNLPTPFARTQATLFPGARRGRMPAPLRRGSAADQQINDQLDRVDHRDGDDAGVDDAIEPLHERAQLHAEEQLAVSVTVEQ